MNILIIGAGMYVTGRGTDHFGTIMPAISEWVREGGSLQSLTMVSTRPESAKLALEKTRELASISGVELLPQIRPTEGEPDRFAYRKVLDESSGFSCAIVVVPDHLHYEVTKDCLDAGLHTLVVKPLTPTVAEARTLAEAAEDRGLYGAVEFHKRWDRSNIMMRDVLRRGDIGEPLYCWMEYSQRKSIPSRTFRDWCEQTSILQYLGVHYIDIVRFATGATPTRAMARGQKKWLVEQGLDTFDAIQCMVEWELPRGGHFTQTILTNWVDPETSSAMSDQKIKFIGTRGRFESDQKERGIRINRDGEPVEHPNPDFCVAYGNGRGQKIWRGYGIESICTFLDDVLGIMNGTLSLADLAALRPTFSEGVISTAVLEAAHASLEGLGNWHNITDLRGTDG